jgi:predicted flap endonuclease-1-like 5' DNA nuclease
MSADDNHEPESELPRSIGAPARRALAAAGYTRLVQLTSVSEAELLRLHGVGPKAIRLLREALAARGLAFAERDGFA